MKTRYIEYGSCAMTIMRRDIRAFLRAGAALAVLVIATNSFAREYCPLCDPRLGVPLVPLSAESLDSLARWNADFNAGQIARIDSALRRGRYGAPDSDPARRRAHLIARLNTVNAYRDLVRLACDSGRVFEANERTLKVLNGRYADVNLFIAARLVHVRIGLGRVCMRYALDERKEGVVRHGGKAVRWWVKDEKIYGQRRRVLKLKFPTGSDDEVQIFLGEHHTFKVEYARSDGPPGPYEWFLVDDIQGAWIRKWGTHRPTAYTFWVATPDVIVSRRAGSVYTLATAGPSMTSAGVVDLPTVPLVGLRLYIKGLRLRMPLLPDINVDDLREIELPMPILDLNYLRTGEYPDWLETDTNLGFIGWANHGPVPEEIRRRFPDL